MSPTASHDVDLSALDPAARNSNRANTATGQALLARVLATPRSLPAEEHAGSQPTGTPTAGERSPSRRASRRWVVAGAVTALAVGAVAVPAVHTSWTSGGSAMASWTPRPEAVAAATADADQADCRAAAPHPSAPVTGALTEQRGDFTFTLVATAHELGSCLLLAPGVVARTGQEEVGVISWGELDSTTPLPSGASTVQWGRTFTSAAGSFTSASGRVALDVTAVTITPRGDQPVQASVADGYFAAWWPGKYNDHLTVTTTTVSGKTTTRDLDPGDQ